MGRQAAAIGCLAVFLVLVPTAASAAQSACYPPPCSGAASTPAAPAEAGPGPDAVPTGAAPASVPGGRASLPYVAAGLLTVMIVFTWIAARRRIEITRRKTHPLHAVLSPPVAEGSMQRRSAAS